MVVVTHTCVSSSRVIVVAVIARLRPPVPQRAPPDGDDHDDDDDGGSHVDGLEARHRECLGLSRVEKPTNHDQERSTPTPTTKEHIRVKITRTMGAIVVGRSPVASRRWATPQTGRLGVGNSFVRCANWARGLARVKGHRTRIHASIAVRVRVTGHIYSFARTPHTVMSTDEAAREDDAGAQVVPTPNDAIHHDGQPRMMHEAALCGKFFSIHGCAYGDDCHFSHVYYPGMLLPPPPAPLPYAYAMGGPQSAGNEKMKTRLCRNFNSPEGCRFGDRCVFAHGEEELRSEETNIALAETTMAMGNMGGFMMPHYGTSGRARRATSKKNKTHISDLP